MKDNSTVAKFIIRITNVYHLSLWNPFIKGISKYKAGKIADTYFRIFCRVLWVFNILTPPSGEAPCLTYLIIRYPNKFNKLSFQEKVRYLKKFSNQEFKVACRK